MDTNLSGVGRVFTLGTFGEALEALKQGLRVARTEWPDGVGLELYVPGGAHSDRYSGDKPTIYVRSVGGAAGFYYPYQLDLLARDWRTV